MRVLFAFLCDYADGTGGKLNALGIGFDEVRTSEIPFRLRTLSVVSEFDTEEGDPESFEVSVEIAGPDGAMIQNLNSEISLPVAMKSSGLKPRARLLAAFDGMECGEAGRYVARIVVAGRIRWESPFQVTLIH